MHKVRFSWRRPPAGLRSSGAGTTCSKRRASSARLPAWSATEKRRLRRGRNWGKSSPRACAAAHVSSPTGAGHTQSASHRQRRIGGEFGVNLRSTLIPAQPSVSRASRTPPARSPAPVAHGLVFEIVHVDARVGRVLAKMAVFALVNQLLFSRLLGRVQQAVAARARERRGARTAATRARTHHSVQNSMAD